VRELVLPAIYRRVQEFARPEEYFIPLSLLAWLFSGAALMLPRSWRRAATALPAFWLGLVGLKVAFGITNSKALAAALQAGEVPPHFLEITAALLLLAIAALIHSAVRDFITSRPAMRWLTALPLLKAALTLWLFKTLWLHARLQESVAVSVGLAGGAWLVWKGAGLLRLGAGVGVVDRWLAFQPKAPAQAERRSTGMLLLAGALVALVPNTTTLIAGTAIAAFGLRGVAVDRGMGGRAWALPMLMLALLPAAWLLLTAAGSVAPSLASLPDAPLSPAAEAFIAPWLCLAVWGLAGLWPLHGLVPPPILAPLGGLVMVRLGVAALPQGMQAWQTIVAPLAVVALLWAGVVSREAMGLAAAAMFAAITAPAGQGDAALLLFALAGVAAALPLVPMAITLPRWLPPRLGWLIPALAAWPVLEAGLRSQVAYTVLMAGGVALAAAVAAAAADREARSR
jgi:hypothetical protein